VIPAARSSRFNTWTISIVPLTEPSEGTFKRYLKSHSMALGLLR